MHLTSHQIDAITAALTAQLYLRDQTESVGNFEEGHIIFQKGEIGES